MTRVVGGCDNMRRQRIRGGGGTAVRGGAGTGDQAIRVTQESKEGYSPMTDSSLDYPNPRRKAMIDAFNV